MEISYSQGKQNKIHVSVDGEYMFTVDAEYWYTCPYCRVKEITDSAECDKFFTEIGSRYAFISGLRLLSYSDNSRKELKLKLLNKGHKPQYVERALDNLEEYGYINDVRFARNKADFLIRRKHMSKNGIKSELLRHGISSDVIGEVLEELELDPVEDIAALLSTKYKRYLNDEKGMRKTVAGLQRLGYGWSDIKTALDRYSPDTEDNYCD